MIWRDTRDMLSDGLNKGTINRVALQLAMNEGKWQIDQPVRIHRVQMPAAKLSQEQPESKGVEPTHVPTHGPAHVMFAAFQPSGPDDVMSRSRTTSQVPFCRACFLPTCSAQLTEETAQRRQICILE